MDNNKFISLDDFTRVLDDVVTKINENYVKKEQNIQTKTVFIFKYNDTIPTRLPSYINWDVSQDIVTISANEGWMLNTDEYVANGRALWMSSGTLTSLEPNNITWASPIRLTGERGPAGLDGTILEYKYRLTQNDLSVPFGPAEAPEEWHSTPSGVSATKQAEWVSSRYKETTDSDFTPWSTPVLWAKYGVNGVDGNGYEYIYYTNNGESVPSLGEYDVNSPEYQLDEYLPSGWSDDPQSVSADQRYVWMSSRKKQNQTWSAFKTPVVWAKFGEKGDTGYLIKTMYTKTDGESAPYYVYNNINPGSSWSSQMPSYVTGEYVWEIKAYFNSNNEFVTVTGSDGYTLYGWSSPILVSGIKGDTGNVPNYKIYVYKFSETQPPKPSTDSPTNITGWDDYPTDMGNAQGRWWQSIGSVNGNSGLVTNWTDPMPINGIDGQHTEFRFKITTDTTTPEIINNVREPEGWTRLNDMADTTVPAGGSMWQVTAEIDDKNNLIGNWSHPVKISGEKGERGERGPVGERGFTGLPGSNITYRYALGDANSVKTSWQNEVTTLKTTDAYPYIWAQIGRDVYEDKDNNGTYEFARTEWDPNGIFIMSGKPGQNGKGGQLVYPAGQYDPNAVYITTEKTAPYVYYDGEYYVLNDVMTWVGTDQNNKTPNESDCWIKFDGFQALHAQIGIIENGLIGSAVFNGDYMFSQWGVCKDGTDIDDSTPVDVLKSCFEKFNPADPYGEDAEFKPNICFNLKTGKVWMNAGKTVFNSDGSGFLADGKIAWDFNGEIDVKQLNALGIVASDISADTITGKTIKSTDETSFVLNENGTFSLGNDAISYDGDTISISGQNVEIDGNVKINGSAIMAGIEKDAKEEFETLIADSISADTILGNEIVGKTVRSDNTIGGTATWILQNTGAGHLAGGNISWDNDGELILKASMRQIPVEKRAYMNSFWDDNPPVILDNDSSDIFLIAHDNDDFDLSTTQRHPAGMGYVEYIEGFANGNGFQEPQLICDNTQIGRRIIITNHRTNEGYTYKPLHLTLTNTNAVFYENGLESKHLIIGCNEIIELFGYGIKNNFMGWIIMNRKFLDYDACNINVHGQQYGHRPAILAISNNFTGYGDSTTNYLYLHPWLHTLIVTKDNETLTLRLPYNYSISAGDSDAQIKGNLIDGLHTGQEFEIWKKTPSSHKIIIELKTVKNTNNENSVIASLMNGKETIYNTKSNNIIKFELTSIGLHKLVWDGYNWFHCRSY